MSVSLIALSAALVGALGVVPGGAQVVVEAPPSISKLVPNAGREVLPDLNGIVRNRDAAVALGKALFWDQQVGSDGQACASCHFAAGADSRVKHQLNPGLLGGDDRFAGVDGFSIGHPDFAANYELKPGDFPFHRLADPNDRNSQILATTNDVSSSQGTFAGGLVSSNPREGFEACGPSGDDRFDINAAGDAGRRVEPRNTPTTINAVLNHRNFWDGRANNVFNGVDPFGLRSEKASPLTRVVKLEGGSLKAVKLRDRNGKPLENFSIASQAVGPTLSDFEMGCAFRSFAQVGRRLFSVTPLGQQELHPQDSDLARYRNRNGIGLRSSYSALIRAAFEPVWWRGDGNGINATFKMEVVGGQTVITPDSHGFTHMEHNFSMFWGGAVGLYEAELVSDQTPFDAFIDANGGKVDASSGNPAPGFGTPEIAGFRVFMNEGKCINCHKGPLFTAAALTHLIAEAEEEGLVERMLMADQENGPALYDNGFYNIGVRPTAEDIGVGGEDPFGNPLSFTRQIFRFNMDTAKHSNA
jgi:cytochrome c peroxidase